VLSVLSRTYSLRLLVALLRLSAPLVVPAFWLLAGAAAGFALVQRAWSTQPRIAAVQLLRVGANSCVLLLSSALWLSGARHGGALVTILAEQSELLVAAGVSAIATDARAAQQHMLGASLMCVGYLLLVVNDDDDQATDGDGARVRNARYALVAHFAASALGMVRERTSRRLAIGIGGPKRLNALEYAGAFALSTPSALWSAARAGASDGAGEPWSWLAGCETALAALAMLVAPFYARALARTWLPSRQPELLTCATAACAALALDLALGPRELLESACAAVGAALVFAGGGAHLRAQAASAETQSLLGVTSTGSRSIGPPLLARAARAARAGWAETRLLLRLIWLRRTTRRLLLFLLVSGVFTVVEAALGRASSSLSLVSDACHMLLDCSGLAIGLYGELSSHWPPTSTHTYGFGRVEVLCTFANATLLLLTAAALSREALSRIVWGGAPVDTARMLVVALGGLGVNVLGLCLFSEHHVHSGSRACPAGCAADGAAGSSNMAAVLLHIAADALGSLGVIVSSLLIQYAGLEIAVSAERARARPRRRGARPRVLGVLCPACRRALSLRAPIALALALANPPRPATLAGPNLLVADVRVHRAERVAAARAVRRDASAAHALPARRRTKGRVPREARERPWRRGACTARRARRRLWASRATSRVLILRSCAPPSAARPRVRGCRRRSSRIRFGCLRRPSTWASSLHRSLPPRRRGTSSLS
jgi:zinc transporter 5/7